MKKIVVMFCCICAASLVSVVSVPAGMFDSVMPGSSAKSSSGSLSKQVFDNFFELSKQADVLMNKSLNGVSTMLLNKEDVEKIERKKKEVEGIKDPKEKEAAFNKVVQDQSAAVEQAILQKDATQKLSKLDANQKKLAKDSIYNLFLSGLKNKTSLDQAKAIVDMAKSSPMAAANFTSEIPRVKDAIAILPGKAQQTITLSNNLIKLCQAAKIETSLPKSATDVPKDVTNF